MTDVVVECWSDRTFAFDPQKTALLVIDMQRHFLEAVEPDGIEAEAKTGPNSGETAAIEAAAENAGETEGGDPQELISNVRRLLDWARAAGCRVVHTREGYSPDLSDVSAFRRDLDYVGHPGPLGRSLIRGETGHDFVPELQPLPGEPVIDKASFGAFFRTELDEILRDAGIERLILCGVTTQCCVHSTLREAVDRGYWCLTVADCCAASDQSLHDAALLLIMGEGHLFGWIADVGDITSAAPSAMV